MTRTIAKSLGAAMIVGLFGFGTASAMPAGQLGETAKQVGNAEQVRLVCDAWGRCWRRPNYYYGGPAIYFGGGPRYYGHRHWGHRHWGGRRHWGHRHGGRRWR